MAHLITVEDIDHPGIAPYRDLRERDLVGRQGLFVAEGEVVLKLMVARAPDQLVSLLIADKRAARLAPLLDRLDPAVPVYCAAPSVFEVIAGFPMHRGILAIGRRAPAMDAGTLLAGLGPVARVVVLFGIANHDNLGGIFRNAAAFGADAVLLDATCCDPYYRKAIRVSVGAALIVPWARLAPDEDGLALLDRHGFETIALSPAGATPLARIRPGPRMAAIFGTEGPGLSTGLLARAQTVAIPMAAGFDSLNVATSSGIVLHHLSRPAYGPIDR